MEKREIDQRPQQTIFQSLHHHLQEWRQRLVGEGLWHSTAVGYLVCLFLEGIALFASYMEQRVSVQPYIASAPFSLITILVAWLWGIGPAALAIVVGFFLLDVFVIPPYGIFTFNGWEDTILYGSYILGALIVLLIVAQRERSQQRAFAVEREMYVQEKEVAYRALFRSNQRLEEFSQQFERENRRKDLYFSQASHELKTPITAVLMQTQLALRRLTKLQPTESELLSLHIGLSQIEAQTHRLNALINDLLDMSSLRSGRLLLRFTECNLGELCCKVATEQQASSDRRIELELPSDPVILQADCQRLTQVLINLITNAIKYSRGNSPVRVCVSQEFPHAICTVHNTGSPIPQEEQAAIFEPFYRTSEAKLSSTVGWGLGLSLCKEIVERHGGRIWVKSSEEEGTTFSISLPLPPIPLK
jgi:signal transduction histidine kinase